MTDIRRVDNSTGQALSAAAERASRGIGSPVSEASQQFESIAGRAPQAGSSTQAPRLSLSSAQSKLSKLLISPTSPSSESQTGQPVAPLPGRQSGAVPQPGQDHLTTPVENSAAPPRRPRGYLHMTHPRNVPSIQRDGLIPKGSEGFGPPTDGRQNFYRGDATYVVDDYRLYGGEARAESAIGVISAIPPEPDFNLPSKGSTHGAGYFVGGVAPLRTAMTDADHGLDRPYSFTLPASPRTQAGAERFCKAAQMESTSPANAAEQVAQLVRERYPDSFPQGVPATPDGSAGPSR